MAPSQFSGLRWNKEKKSSVNDRISYGEKLKSHIKIIGILNYVQLVKRGLHRCLQGFL